MSGEARRQDWSACAGRRRSGSASTPAQEDRHPGVHLRAAQMPWIVPAHQVLSAQRLSGRRRRHVAENGRSQPAHTGMAGNVIMHIHMHILFVSNDFSLFSFVHFIQLIFQFSTFVDFKYCMVVFESQYFYSVQIKCLPRFVRPHGYIFNTMFVILDNVCV